MFEQANSLTIKDSRPFLSILLPAFKYRQGVRRILSLLQSQPFEDLELIVSDDSPDDEVEQEIAFWQSDGSMQMTYHRNRPTIGAAANWNLLLDKARGKYCLLLHHDDFPLSEHFVRELILELSKNPDADVVMLDCILINPQNGRCRRHLPTWLRAFVVKRFPQYLFRRNVIGPTSLLVVRRELYPRFDEKLKWLIDVEVYVRLLKVAKSLRFSPKIKIGSLLGRRDSITAGLGASIPQIVREERAYLRSIHQTPNLWLGPVRNEPISHSLVRVCEAVCWNLMRGIARIPSIFCVCPVSRSVVKKAIEIPSGS